MSKERTGKEEMITFLVTKGQYSDYDVVRAVANLPEGLRYIDSVHESWDYRVESYDPEFANSWYYKDDKLTQYFPKDNSEKIIRHSSV